jgi:dTDP-4-dehydrorhamnose reductase
LIGQRLGILDIDMAVLVAGCEGQLGAELCRQLGAGAVGMDLPQLDLSDRDQVLATVRGLRPAAVVNTAAYTRVDQAEKEPGLCRAVNATGVGHLAEACREVDCPLVQISTDYVFAGDTGRDTPYAENDPVNPAGVYAITKFEGEQCAAAWAKHFIVRTCGLYGPPAPRSAGNFVATMLRLGRERESLRIVRDQHCTPSYVPHLARAVRFLLSTDAYGLYHVVNGGATTWYDFAAEIFRLAGISIRLVPITTAEYGAPAPRPSYSVLDISKYHALPGCPRMPSWQEALAEHLHQTSRNL